ncbi:MAG: DUF2442 domain-containing protein [Alphaproteobacteria bacterium]
MPELPCIANVEALPGRRLCIRWRAGHETVVDMSGVIADFPPFAPLAEPEEFTTATVAGYGSGVAWACGLDYSADSLDLLSRSLEPGRRACG